LYSVAMNIANNCGNNAIEKNELSAATENTKYFQNYLFEDAYL